MSPPISTDIGWLSSGPVRTTYTGHACRGVLGARSWERPSRSGTPGTTPPWAVPKPHQAVFSEQEETEGQIPEPSRRLDPWERQTQLLLS